MNEAPTRPPDSGPPASQGSGLAPNVAGALAYLLGPVTGVVFLVIDRERPFVRFHAMQAILVSVAWIAAWVALSVLGFILGQIPVLGFILTGLLWLALAVVGFVLWLYLMYQAFQGREWEVPVLGEHARRLGQQATPPGAP